MAKRTQMPKKTASQRGKKALPQKSVPSRNLLLVLIAGVVVIAAGLVLLIIQTGRQSVSATNRLGEGTAWGPEGAPVSVIVYSDFGCTFCAVFAQAQGEQLRAEYEPTGKVRLEYRHFVIEGPTTAGAGNAAECAADQGKFWDYHDALFSQQGTSSAPFSKSALKQYAAQLGLDTASFNLCVDTDKHLDKVYRDTSQGRAQGVDSTPTIFVDGQKIVGAQEYSVFKAAVDAALLSGG